MSDWTLEEQLALGLRRCPACGRLRQAGHLNRVQFRQPRQRQAGRKIGKGEQQQAARYDEMTAQDGVYYVCREGCHPQSNPRGQGINDWYEVEVLPLLKKGGTRSGQEKGGPHDPRRGDSGVAGTGAPPARAAAGGEAAVWKATDDP